MGTATRITVGDRPGGVLFRRAVNPGRQHQLVISGRGDRFSLRLNKRGDAGEYTYLHAPQGEMALNISGVREIEVLIYSDSPGVYTLDNVTLRDCTNCGMEMQSWESPRLFRTGGSIHLSVGSAPAGASFAQKLDPTRRYRLRVAGRGDNVSLRITTRGATESMEYVTAPQGDMTLNFSGIGAIEVLIYSDTPAEYTIEDVRIDDCEDCRLAEDLIRIVRQAIPNIDSLSQYDRSVALMRWASTAANYTADQALTPQDFESWPVYRQYFEFFLPLSGGVSCGGIAVFAANVMRLFDIDAMTINYGVSLQQGKFATHVSVVARIGDDYYLLDPTFSATVESDAGPVPFERALVAVARQSDAIRVADADLSGRANIGPITTQVFGLCDRRSINARGIDICRIDHNRRFLDIFGENQRDIWLSEGVELDRTSLVSLVWRGVFSIEGGLTPESNDLLIERLKGIGVPFHN